MRIGKEQTKTFIAGIAGTALSGATVVVKSNGQLGVVASSARYKQDIKPLAGGSGGTAEKLARLRPVSYRYKTEPEATHYGLIAEEVDKVMPELVVRDGENRPELGAVPGDDPAAAATMEGAAGGDCTTAQADRTAGNGTGRIAPKTRDALSSVRRREQRKRSWPQMS